MKRRWGFRGTDRVLLVYLVVCACVVVVGLIARSGETQPSPNIYEGWQLALGFPCVIVGGYVAARAPRHPLGWLFVTAGLTSWWSALASSMFARGWVHSIALGRTLTFIGFGGWVWFQGIVLVLVPMAYPSGRLWRGAHVLRKVWLSLAAFVVAAAGLCNAIPMAAMVIDTGSPAAWTAPFQRSFAPLLKAEVILAVIAGIDLLVRVARLRAAVRRRHIVFAVGIVLLTAPSLVALAQIFGWFQGFDQPELQFVPEMLLPVALAYGVLRHGALGFRTVVRRTAFYAGVTFVSAALYIAVVSIFSAGLQRGSGIGPVVATGLVAVSLQPVRTLVQQVVDRWVFGDRDEPYRALAGLGRRLGGTDDDPLAVVAEVVRSSLKLAAVAIEWEGSEGHPVVVARAAGAGAGGAVERIPILFEGRRIADLVATRREGERAASPAESRLLSDLAGAAGAVVQSALYADEVARSRGNLVRAREEERRRLRHDLHDGLGPTLASVAMGLDAAANRLHDDPELSGLLHDLDRALQDAIADIRRLVAGLRPPALDDLGLVPALREQAVDMTSRSRRGDGAALAIEVAAAPGLPVMAAAVEVAAYRIAVEGMTNVLRHSGATECMVRLAPATGPNGDALEVVVEDDGRGIDDGATSGIGLESMRNRAEELGGRLRIGRRPGGGTVLAALLPLHDPRRELAPA